METRSAIDLWLVARIALVVGGAVIVLCAGILSFSLAPSCDEIASNLATVGETVYAAQAAQIAASSRIDGFIFAIIGGTAIGGGVLSLVGQLAKHLQPRRAA